MSSSSSSSSSDDSENTMRRRRGGDYYHHHHQFEGPSSSRQRSHYNEVWPEPFLEALAYQVAVDSAQTLGPLAAAPALSNVFQ
ncbi:Transcriptional regulator sterile apetala, partial [Thalictrum thalictroides]